MNKKGFTLIELLAVIIILGVLILISVPSISGYVETSRKETYKANLDKLVDGVSMQVNANEDGYQFSTNEFLVVPLSCIELERGNNDKTPFGNFIAEKSFVLVMRNNSGFDYYVSAIDDRGFGNKISLVDDIKIKAVSANDVGTITDEGVMLGTYQSLVGDKTAKIVTCDKYLEQVDKNEQEDKPEDDDKINGPELVKKIGDAILSDNNAESDANIDFSKTSKEDGTSGLYYTSTNTKNNKTTYYFRGNVVNNFIAFEKDIIKTNSCQWDNNGYESVGFYDSTTGNILESYEMNKETCLSSSYICTDNAGITLISDSTDSSWCTTTINTQYGGGFELVTGKTEWITNTSINENKLWQIVRINEDGSVRLIYNGDYPTGTHNSVYINPNPWTEFESELNDFYEDNLSGVANYLADAGFCMDRSSYNSSYYGAYGRLTQSSVNPKFACPNITDDLYTTNSSSIGNKALDYPIGLLTADEYVYAGASWNKENNAYYLANGIISWTMTPYSETKMFVISDLDTNDYDYLTDYSKSQFYNFRPVINVKGTVSVTGDGTYQNPYIIK